MTKKNIAKIQSYNFDNYVLFQKLAIFEIKDKNRKKSAPSRPWAVPVASRVPSLPPLWPRRMARNCSHKSKRSRAQLKNYWSNLTAPSLSPQEAFFVLKITRRKFLHVFGRILVLSVPKLSVKMDIKTFELTLYGSILVSKCSPQLRKTFS